MHDQLWTCNTKQQGIKRQLDAATVYSIMTWKPAANLKSSLDDQHLVYFLFYRLSDYYLHKMIIQKYKEHSVATWSLMVAT